MNYVISNFTEYKFVLSENKKDVFQAHFTVLHCYDNLCTDYFEKNLSFISDKKKPFCLKWVVRWWPSQYLNVPSTQNAEAGG